MPDWAMVGQGMIRPQCRRQATASRCDESPIEAFWAAGQACLVIRKQRRPHEWVGCQCLDDHTLSSPGDELDRATAIAGNDPAVLAEDAAAGGELPGCKAGLASFGDALHWSNFHGPADFHENSQRNSPGTQNQGAGRNFAGGGWSAPRHCDAPEMLDRVSRFNRPVKAAGGGRRGIGEIERAGGG